MICENCKQPDSCSANERCFGETARSISFGTVPGGTRNASREVTNPKPPEASSWEKGRAGEERPGGSRMPYLNAQGERMGIKEMSENRKHYEGIRRRQLAS